MPYTIRGSALEDGEDGTFSLDDGRGYKKQPWTHAHLLGSSTVKDSIV
jgi:hypothetical protein